MKLFAEINDKLILKIDLYNNDGHIIAKKEESFIVENIIGYGFDLVSLKSGDVVIRIINSEMGDYFYNNI